MSDPARMLLADLVVDLVRAAVIGFGALLVLVIVKAVQERWQDRHSVQPVMIERPSSFALLSYVIFAGGYVVSAFQRSNEDDAHWSLWVAFAGLVTAMLASRSLFTFQWLAWRESRSERKSRREPHDH